MHKSEIQACSIADAKRIQLTGDRSVQMFAHGSMRVKFYAPQGVDDQVPHRQDELYVVIDGTGTFGCGSASMPFEPGTVLFAPAGVEHRFENFTDDFCTWVIFYGPDGGEQGAAS